MSPPDLAIVLGARKAGTTTLFERLGSHPRVAPSTPKEPGFFARADRWQRGHDWYRDRWPRQLGDRIRLEASTTYAAAPRHPATFDRMRTYLDEHGLEARFVYSLRDPLERIRSNLTHWRAAGNRARVEATEAGHVDGLALALSMYAHQIDRFRERFDRSQLKLVRFGQLAEDTAGVLADVCSFLGLDPGEVASGSDVHNPSSEKYEKSRAWQALERLGLDEWTDAVPERVLDRVRRTLGSRIEGKVELNDAQERAYLRALEGDLRRLREVYDVDIDGWRLPAALADP